MLSRARELKVQLVQIVQKLGMARVSCVLPKVQFYIGKVQIVQKTVKRDVSALWMLDWAYRKELVRCAGDEQVAAYLSKDDRSSWQWVMGAAVGSSGRGSIAGHLDVDEDALRVHVFVLKRCGHELARQTMLCAEKGVAVPSEWRGRPGRYVPVMRVRRGIEEPVVYIDPTTRRPYLCPMVWDGGPRPEVCDRLRIQQIEIYANWIALLHVMVAGLAVDKFNLVETGLDNLRRIIDTGQDARQSRARILHAAAP